MIGLGVVTCNRPEYFAEVMAGVVKHLGPVVDHVYVYNDGSDRQHADAYRDAYLDLPREIEVTHARKNLGVGIAKNALLRRMMHAGAHWLFLLEDDVVPQCDEAVTGYVAAAQASELHHLAFHAHGPANAHIQPEVDGPVSYWPNSVGAFCLYSRVCLARVGLMDEHFLNAFEHVEHTMRLADAGYTTGYPRFADATGSERWLAEIPGSVEHSSIVCNPEHRANFVAGREYWKRVRPDTYHRIWPTE